MSRLGLAALVLALAPCAPAEQGPYGLGHQAGAKQIAGWNIDVEPDGTGLPEGQGSVIEGERLYGQMCARCHGAFGTSPSHHRIAGGRGSLDSSDPLRTVGSYWPYATTLFDYIRRAMPFDAPRALNVDQVYAATAYVLYLNEIVDRDAVMSPETLPQVQMPNRDGFIRPDPRPDVDNQRCMQDCK